MLLLLLLILSVNSYTYNYFTQDTIDDKFQFSLLLTKANVSLQLVKISYNITVVNDYCNISFFSLFGLCRGNCAGEILYDSSVVNEYDYRNIAFVPSLSFIGQNISFEFVEVVINPPDTDQSVITLAIILSCFFGIPLSLTFIAIIGMVCGCIRPPARETVEIESNISTDTTVDLSMSDVTEQGSISSSLTE
jgi:hypothetical protein